MFSKTIIVLVSAVGCCAMASAGLATAQQPAQFTAKGGNADAAKIPNPTPASAESIARGKVVFQASCVPCHGPNADGKGEQIPAMGVKPANLTRFQYTYGTSDGEIFTNVKNGVLPDLNMPPWDEIVSDPDIWNIVNYLRTMRKPN
jgi:mono/diheme cytochrome c family protein